MDSRFFCFHASPKESFFSIRKVGIREPDKSNRSLLPNFEAKSIDLQLVHSLDILISGLPAKYIFNLKQIYYEHNNECIVLDSQGTGGMIRVKRRSTCALQSQVNVSKLGTRRFVLPENWSADSGRVKGIDSNAKSVNTYP